VNFSLKAKALILKLRLVRQSVFIVTVLFFLLSTGAIAQVRPERRIGQPVGTLPQKNDTSRFAQPDTLLTKNDSLRRDSVQTVQPKGDIETTINYTARDSIRASMDGKMIWLYGEAKITYGTIELEAEEIIIDYANNTISAQGRRDSLGNRIGYPIFKNGQELYETKGIVYNFKTRRARIREVVTQQGEGYLHSEAAFKNEKNEIFSINNSYTTCSLAEPHFQIRATKTKAIPDDKIVAGPFYLEFNKIPLPAGFLFGMFPAQRESKSGIIFPSYGEERRRGFNLRRGGYFFDINDYVKLALTGDIYSKGSHALYANSNYMKRYAYNGQVNFSYSKTVSTENIEDRSAANDFMLMWSHSPQSKGTGRFAASVNAATSSYNKNNNLMYGAINELSTSRLNNISTKLSSNVSYNKRFSGTPLSMGINLSHNQDLQTGIVDLPLPNVSLNMTNLYPFQRKGKTSPLDNFSIGYTMTGTNRITNRLGPVAGADPARDSIAPFNFDNLSYFFRNGKKGIRHSIPTSFSFKALKFFTVSPSISLEEKWYFEKQNWAFNSDSSAFVITDTTRQFNRITNYAFSTALNTRIYGMYFFNRPGSKVKAIRHIINPSISFGYTPDFSGNEDYFNRFVNKQKKTVYQSRHTGFVYGGSNIGESGSIGLALGNNLEMKVKAPKDTVERKVMLLNNLSIGTSYNIVADSFNLAPIGISANTSILDNKININLSTTVDPYSYWAYETAEGRAAERRIENYALKTGSLGRITSAALAINTNLNPEAREKEQSTREKVAQSDLPEEDKQEIIRNPNAYVDFDIPWTMNLSYTLAYTHSIAQDPKFIQTLQASGTLSISEKWMIRYNTGFDFEAKEFTQTNMGISRDLHCWTMALDWVPFGRFQSYNFTIAVKAAVLQDLKLERRKPWLDNQ
jgi:hypothetical protein